MKKVLYFLRDLLPHLLIAGSVLMLTCCVLNNFNKAMKFINNSLTAGILPVFCRPYGGDLHCKRKKETALEPVCRGNRSAVGFDRGLLSGGRVQSGGDLDGGHSCDPGPGFVCAFYQTDQKILKTKVQRNQKGRYRKALFSVPLDGKAGKSLPFRLIFRGIGESEFFSKKVKKGVDKPNGICYNQTRRRTKGENLDPYGSIAQLGEHLPYKQRVIGSSPIVPTKGNLKKFPLRPGSSVG